MRAALSLVLCGGVLMACAPSPPPARLAPVNVLAAASPAEVGMHPGLSVQLDSIIEAALTEGAAPGAVLAVGRHGRLVHLKGYGRLDWADDSPRVDPSTLYDLASVTKVVATTTAAMLLEEEGRLELDRRVVDYLPEFGAPEKAAISVRLLLEHRGGMEAFAPLFREFSGREQYLEQINLRPLRRPPGTETEYSDWDLILLQLIVERLSGQTLDAFLAERLFSPLGMLSTRFNPLGPPPPLEARLGVSFDTPSRARIAPTEVDTVFRHTHVHGYVHDENAWALGGVAGHAGLFSTAHDLALFAQMMLNGGEYNGVQLVRPAAIARWTAPQVRGSSRALGWDTPARNSSAGRFFSPRSFGHTGFTGTSMWMDPERDLFVILLTNRVNPTRENTRHVPLRRAVADAAQAAILDAPLIDWEARR